MTTVQERWLEHMSEEEIGAATAVRLATPTETKLLQRWPVHGFQDAMQSQRQRPPWTITDLLMAQSATLVSALPHSIKSLSWLHACLEASACQKVWDHFDASGVTSTLFIETEDPEWLVEARIRGFAKGLGLDANAEIPGFHYVCPGPFDFVEEHLVLQKTLESYHPSFAVISTLQSTVGNRKMGQQSDMAPIMRIIIELSRRICPIVLITHSPWDRRQKRALGSVTQTANFLTTMHYEKLVGKKDGETYVHVGVDSKAGGEQTDFHLRLLTDGDASDPGSVRRLIYGRGWPKGVGKAAILAAIEDDPDASAAEIADRVGVSKRYVERVLANQEHRKKGAKEQEELADVVEQLNRGRKGQK